MEDKELLKKLQTSNLLSLAFLGDAVHTLFVRKRALDGANDKMNNYHSYASKYCKASHQGAVYNRIAPLLTEEEQEVARRARNAKPKHQAKNASHADYMLATMFEAIVGYLYLKGDNERLNEILELSIQD